MKTANYSAQFLRQRKFYTYLPLLVLPFITLMFWALIARKTPGNDGQSQQESGLMLSVPEAFFKENKVLNKLSYYQKADADSARLRELIGKDPYYQDTTTLDKVGWPVAGIQGLDGPGKSRSKPPGQIRDISNRDPHQARVHQKLSELNQILAGSTTPGFQAPEHIPAAMETTQMPTPEVNRLEELIRGLEAEPQSAQEDPEMKELNEMLEKILDVQHPERLTAKIKHQSEQSQDQIYPLSIDQNEDLISLLASNDQDSLHLATPTAVTSEESGFYSLDEPAQAISENAIQAVIAETQTLVSGSTVKLRLTKDIYISGQLIPKESFVYGTASLNQERLAIQIASLRHESSIFPVKLSVYDLDGIAGIHIPGALSRDVSKQSLSQNIQGLDIDTFQPSVGAQLTDAAVQTAKNLAAKTSRLIRVTIRAGYQVLLKDGNSERKGLSYSYSNQP